MSINKQPIIKGFYNQVSVHISTRTQGLSIFRGLRKQLSSIINKKIALLKKERQEIFLVNRSGMR